MLLFKFLYFVEQLAAVNAFDVVVHDQVDALVIESFKVVLFHVG